LTLQADIRKLRGAMDDSSSNSGSGPYLVAPSVDLRRGRRAKMTRPLRVRPSEPRDEHFVDLPTSVNASKTGIYFTTKRTDYYKGMRVFVTFPFTSAHDPMNSEYLAEVVRLDRTPDGKLGVALDLKMTVNMASKLGSKPRA